MIVTSMRLTTSSRRDIAVLRKESSSLEGEEDVKMLTTYHIVTGACDEPRRASTAHRDGGAGIDML